MKTKFRTLENIGSSVWKLVILECMMSKVNSSEFSVVDVRVTAIVVITVPSPVAVTALSVYNQNVKLQSVTGGRYMIKIN